MLVVGWGSLAGQGTGSGILVFFLHLVVHADRAPLFPSCVMRFSFNTCISLNCVLTDSSILAF